MVTTPNWRPLTGSTPAKFIKKYKMLWPGFVIPAIIITFIGTNNNKTVI